MSRIGKQPIQLPSSVTITLEGSSVIVSGPKGSLTQKLPPGISIDVGDGKVTVQRVDDLAQHKASHGLMRALLANMVTGVSEGYERQLEIHGVGYRVQSQADSLRFNLGYSHEVVYKLPTGISAKIDQNIVTLNGIDKQQVGQAAAEIRALRKPEPYKGKGIRYAGEQILRKSGKSTKE